MVNTVSLIVALALTPLGIAAPAPEAEIVRSDFSFSKWVDTLITDPDNALTPEEALAAAEATLDARSVVDKRQSGINCLQQTNHPAGDADAVTCINFLAAAGRAGVACAVSCTATQVAFANSARIFTQSLNCNLKSVNCNQVARAAGAIMDNCWRADHTVAGNAYAPAPDTAVIVHLAGLD